MASHASDLPDPLDRSDDHALSNPDDLISQLAGEEIARLLAPDANWQPAPSTAPELKPSPVREQETPVEELAAQLDQLFEEIRQGVPNVPASADLIFDDPEPGNDDNFEAEPVLVMRRRSDEMDDNVLGEPRHTLIAPLDEDPLPPALRPLAWLNAPVMDLGTRARFAVSFVSALSFIGSIWALVYVLMLRSSGSY